MDLDNDKKRADACYAFTNTIHEACNSHFDVITEEEGVNLIYVHDMTIVLMVELPRLIHFLLQESNYNGAQARDLWYSARESMIRIFDEKMNKCITEGYIQKGADKNE